VGDFRMAHHYAMHKTEALERGRLDDSFSAQKRMVISKLRYVPITRVYLQIENQIRTNQKLSGYASTDLPTRTIADFTDTQPGTRANYRHGNLRSECANCRSDEPEERVRWGLENVSKVFPEMAGEF